MTVSQRTFIVVILSAVLAVAGSEIYAPSLPHLVREFNVSLHLVQWSMAIYMIGICTTQLVYGPISDQLGRRKPMIFGMTLFTLGAILGATAQSMEALLIARFIQGVGAGGPTGLWRSTFRDIYHGSELAHKASYVTLAISAVLPISPALGGYLESVFGWQGSFVFMTIYGVFSFLFLFFGFQETNKSLSTDPLTIRSTMKTYWAFTKNRIFMGGTIVTSLIFGVKFSAAVATPVFFIKSLGLTPLEFGWVTTINVAASYTLSSLYNTRMVKKKGVAFMLRLGMASVFTAGLLLGVSYLLIGLNTFLLILSLFCLYFGGALVFPSAFSTAFTPLTHHIGYASAFYGFSQTAGGALVSSLIAALPDETPLSFAFLIVITSLIAWYTHTKLVLQAPQSEGVR